MFFIEETCHSSLLRRSSSTQAFRAPLIRSGYAHMNSHKTHMLHLKRRESAAIGSNIFLKRKKRGRKKGRKKWEEEKKKKREKREE